MGPLSIVVLIIILWSIYHEFGFIFLFVLVVTGAISVTPLIWIIYQDFKEVMEEKL
jgi:hypothetical protein